jgi:hypothetical protein
MREVIPFARRRAAWMLNGSAKIAAVIDLITLIVVAVVALMLVLGMYYWARSQSKAKAMGDVDWEREKERLLLLASAKKASRKADESSKKAKPDKKDESGV